MNVLVINCGSSSLKYQVIDSVSEQVLAKGLCERIGIDGRLTYQKAGLEKEITDKAMPTHKEAISLVLSALTNDKTGALKNLSEIGAVGHRIVHGGERFTKSCVIDDEVIKGVEEVSDLAPLHNPANIIGINACRELMPNTPMVGVFDTAFHQTMPEKAYMYGLPYSYYENYKVRKYGFHGTSHSYVSKRVAEIEGKPYEQVKTIVCHLGNGASICAVKNGKSVDTSMGLSPLEGLIMGTRSGDIDPSVIEFIAKKENLDISEVLNILNKKSGVQGLSKVSSDFRDLSKAMDEGNELAKITLETYAYRVAKYVGSYVAAMNGVDVIAFTAGIGENDGRVREMVGQYFDYL
jgi:acetate kinase